MERRSLAERFERLEARQAELASSKIAAQPHAVHVQTVKVLAELLSMGEKFSTGNVHPGLRAMMRMLKRLEPELVKELAVVPPQAIREFLGDLVRRILTVIEVAEEEPSGHPAVAVAADQPGADQPKTA